MKTKQNKKNEKQKQKNLRIRRVVGHKRQTRIVQPCGNQRQRFKMTSRPLSNNADIKELKTYISSLIL